MNWIYEPRDTPSASLPRVPRFPAADEGIEHGNPHTSSHGVARVAVAHGQIDLAAGSAEVIHPDGGVVEMDFLDGIDVRFPAAPTQDILHQPRTGEFLCGTGVEDWGRY